MAVQNVRDRQQAPYQQQDTKHHLLPEGVLVVDQLCQIEHSLRSVRKNEKSELVHDTFALLFYFIELLHCFLQVAQGEHVHYQQQSEWSAFYPHDDSALSVVVLINYNSCNHDHHRAQ